MDKLTEDLLDHVAHRFKLLGEPMRLKLLSSLKDGEKCVQELVNETGAGQANISKHLSLLVNDGILDRRKDGLHVYYFIVDDTVDKLCNLVCESLEKSAADMQKAFK